MTISQLHYFTTIVQLESMSRAANALYMSQSSLSKNITKLETELGMSLFERAGKKLTLNAQGARFFEFCNLVLREFEFAKEDMCLLATGSDSRIKIGAAGSSRKLFDCISAFHQEQPGAEFNLNCGIESMDYLDINEFDMLIYPSGAKYEKFKGYPLYEERYFLAVPVSHPLAETVSILPSMLDDQNFVFISNGKHHVEYPFSACMSLAVRFGSQCHVNTREPHRQMIASGIAVGFVPEGGASFYLSDQNIRLIPILDKRFSRTMMICFRRDKHLSKLAKAFRDFAMEYFHLEP